MQKDHQTKQLSDQFIKKKCLVKGMTIQNRFKVLGQIGQGSFGRVYKAFDAQKRQYVALKFIDIQKILQFNNIDKQYIKKVLKSEGNILRKCNHKNLLQCYGIYQNEKFKIIVTKYCENGNLYQQIQKKKVFYEDQAIKVIHQIVLGLAELHKMGIIHRDMKPQNIFIHRGCYKIGDFGFAKQIPQKVSPHSFKGTNYYKAPQIKMRRPYNSKADIFSLGIIFYQMICSQKDLFARIKKANSVNWSDFKVRGRQKPSQLTIDFLEKCLTDQQNRMGWKQLINHPIFNQKRESIANYYQISVMSLSKLSLSQIANIENSNIQSDEYFDSSKNLSENFKNKDLTSIKMQQILQIQKQDDNQQIIYRELIQSNLCCLKANYIYINYVMAIQKNYILDLNKRRNIQLMYLLVCRCFFYLSRIIIFQQKQKDITQQLKQYVERIKDIYRTVKKSKQIYEKKLTIIQNHFYERFKDKFKNNKNKDRFLVGIQSIDYQIQQHIQYTQKLLHDKISQINCHQEDVKQKIIPLFEWYDKINNITIQQVYMQKFQKICKKILDKNRF